MANKDLYNVFGSTRNSGAGQTQMMKKRTPRSTENTHEHTSGSFDGQNMVNQLTKRATPIGTRQATPINQTADTMTQQLTKAAQSTPMTGGAVMKTRPGGTATPTGGGVGVAGPKQMNPKKRSGGATR